MGSICFGISTCKAEKRLRLLRRHPDQAMAWADAICHQHGRNNYARILFVVAWLQYGRLSCLEVSQYLLQVWWMTPFSFIVVGSWKSGEFWLWYPKFTEPCHPRLAISTRPELQNGKFVWMNQLPTDVREPFCGFANEQQQLRKKPSSLRHSDPHPDWKVEICNSWSQVAAKVSAKCWSILDARLNFGVSPIGSTCFSCFLEIWLMLCLVSGWWSKDWEQAH